MKRYSDTIVCIITGQHDFEFKPTSWQMYAVVSYTNLWKKPICILMRLIHLTEEEKFYYTRRTPHFISHVCLPFLCVSTAVVVARAFFSVFFRHERIRAYISFSHDTVSVLYFTFKKLKQKKKTYFSLSHRTKSQMATNKRVQIKSTDE